MFLTDKPTVLEVGPGAYVLNCFGMATPMLFVGSKRALLIDTGCGNCDLMEVVRSITQLPVICAVSHEHADHIGGIWQFNQVYAPRLELETIRNTTGAFFQKFLDFFNDLITEPDGTIGQFRPQTRYLGGEKMPELIALDDGDSFDLGGRVVTAYRCQVHSKGHLVFVDSGSRILYAGDSISDNTGPASHPMNPPTVVSLEDELAGLENVKAHRAEFDRIYGGHLDWGGHPQQQLSFSPAVLDRMLEVGRGALDGTLEIYQESGSHGTRNYAQKGRTRLYFFGKYLHSSDLDEQYRYDAPIGKEIRYYAGD